MFVALFMYFWVFVYVNLTSFDHSSISNRGVHGIYIAQSILKVGRVEYFGLYSMDAFIPATNHVMPTFKNHPEIIPYNPGHHNSYLPSCIPKSGACGTFNQ